MKKQGVLAIIGIGGTVVILLLLIIFLLNNASQQTARPQEPVNPANQTINQPPEPTSSDIYKIWESQYSKVIFRKSEPPSQKLQESLIEEDYLKQSFQESEETEKEEFYHSSIPKNKMLLKIGLEE